MEKQLLALLTVTLLTSAAYFMNGKDESLTLEGQFSSWKQLHGKRYSDFEEVHRFSVFAQNLAVVMEHNSKFELGQETFTLGMNQYADLTPEEFQASFLTLKTKVQDRKNVKSYSGLSFPDTVDWKDGLTVKNQGSCGSCWAFAAAAAIEAGFQHHKKNKVNISEQEFVDCTTEKLGYESQGCNGGWMDDAFDYTVNYGVTTEEEYPYKGVDQPCPSGFKKKHFISSFVDVEPLSSDALHEAIAKTPVAVAIKADGILFQLYSGGVYSRSCTAKTIDDLNHGVLAVGYAKDSYTIKNSWGASWGEKGYMRLGLVAAKEGQCGIHWVPSYPVL
ncbi:unnamed protein product (macronuclear) [Paramecium tetraurelia]|uniref:cathepsin L n=1 Tax=Paramecium tetraurelia TaxID=5888 RepID=A0CHV8_PARTE|nr:uncharacterized protein GSPATT00038477001 [Paramecium tetraurelia]CAK70375.1 unnamed protein product [Paramecium tetraurelia]|eukprot:XP_001437772.1 hypothetical protein (macronuclear) [Paramecium tetraurelia strain d4-2]